MTDGTDEYNTTNCRVSFFYDLVKAAVNRMAFTLAHELKPHGATAVSLTPGWLRPEAMLDAYRVTESNWRDATNIQPHFAISESRTFVGRAVAALAADPNVSRWSGTSLSSGQLAKIYGFTDRDGSQPDAWRYVVEVQDADGLPIPSAIDDVAKQGGIGVSFPCRIGIPQQEFEQLSRSCRRIERHSNRRVAQQFRNDFQFRAG